MGTARRAAIATLVAGGIIVARARALATSAGRRAALLRDDHRRRDAAGHRVARTSPRPAAGRPGAPLPRAARGDRAWRSRSPCPVRSTRSNHALSPSGKAEIAQEAQHSTGSQARHLTALQKRLDISAGARARKARDTARPEGVRSRDRHLLHSCRRGLLDLRARQGGRRRLLAAPATKRKLVRDTWTLIDLRLGAFVRGQAILIVAVGITLSLLFWAIGEPYWLLVGSFAGLVEIIPVIGPLIAGALAIASA